mgnify:CR=1 FL=1
MKKAKKKILKKTKELILRAQNIILEEGEDDYDKACALVDLSADLLFAGRLSDLDPMQSLKEIEKYMDRTQHLILHGIFLIGRQYEKEADKTLPDSSPGSFDDISIDDALKGLLDNG